MEFFSNLQCHLKGKFKFVTAYPVDSPDNFSTFFSSETSSFERLTIEYAKNSLRMEGENRAKPSTCLSILRYLLPTVLTLSLRDVLQTFYNKRSSALI